MAEDLHRRVLSASLRPSGGDWCEIMRKFLVVLDDSRESLNAIRYAAMRAAKTGGGVQVLSVIPANSIQHGFGVADVMRAEAYERIEAEPW